MTSLAVFTGWHSPTSVLTDWLSPWAAEQQVQLHPVYYPGYDGTSGNADQWQPESLSASLLKQLPADVVLLGWSLGGMLADWLAGQSGYQARAIITLGSNVQFQGSADWQMPAREFDSFRRRFEKRPEKTLQAFSQLQVQGSDVPQQAWLAEQLSHVSIDPEAADASLALLGELDLSLHRPACPELHLLGKQDALVPAICEERWQEVRGEDSVQVLPGNHLFYLDPANKVLALIDRFIDEVRV